MPKAHSSYIATTTTTRTRTVDSLTFPFLARPQAMTAYVRYLFQGVQPVLTNGGASPRILHLGAGTGARWLLYENPGGNGWGIQTVNAAGTANTVNVTAAATRGNLIEVVGWLYANGSVNLTVSVNGGTAATGTQSSAAALATAWSNAVLRFGSVSATAGVSIFPCRDILIVRGVHSLATMRTRLGLTP